MARFKLSPLADADLDEIWDYISNDSDEMADKFIRLLVGKFDLLAGHPSIGRNRDDLRPQLRSFPYGNYIIFYFPTVYGAEIYRILHGARDIGQIFSEELE